MTSRLTIPIRQKRIFCSLLFGLLLCQAATAAHHPRIHPRLPSPALARMDIRPVSQRIIGGSAADAPSWMVALHYDGASDRAFCGATLVSEYWVLTAAHCLIDLYPEEIRVSVGQSRLGSGELYEVAELIIHPSYLDPLRSVDADVALIRLQRPVTGASPIPLETDPAAAQAGLLAWVLGWGATCQDCPGTNQLREAFIPIASRDAADLGCAYPVPSLDDAIVAGFPEGGIDSCFGDSGGPLLIASAGGEWRQVGIVSYGPPEGCALPNGYGIYSSIPWHHSWILRQIANYPAPPNPGEPFFLTFSLNASSPRDPTRTGGYPARFIPAPSAMSGQSLFFEASSAYLDPYLTLTDLATGTVLARSTPSPSDPTAVILQWTVPPGAIDRARLLVVSTADARQTGGITVSSLSHADTVFASTLTSLSPARAESGFLHPDSPTYDLGEGYFYEDFWLVSGTDGERASVSVSPAGRGGEWIIDVYDYTLEAWVGEGDSDRTASFVFRQDHFMVASVYSNRTGDFEVRFDSPRHAFLNQEVTRILGTPASNHHGNYFCSPWLGSFEASSFPVVEHAFWGPLWLEGDAGRLWFWQFHLGWSWSGQDVWPFLYSTEHGWLWSFPGVARPYWFWAFNLGSWISV